jgi:hypothetical protein
MYKLVLLCLLIGSVVSQNRVPPPGLPGQNYPTVTGWNPADPNHPCNQPGVNCNINSRFAEESSYSDYRGNRERYINDENIRDSTKISGSFL